MDIDAPRTPGMSGAAADGRLSEQLEAVAATARRRASRGGDREVDTAHLLHSLLEADPAVREFLDSGGPRTARLLAYLAQRSIGYGLRWRHSVEEGSRRPVRRGAGSPPRSVPDSGRADAGSPHGWSPAAARALTFALDRVAARGAARAECVDLFAGLLADPGCRAAEVLRTSGVDVRGIALRLVAATAAAGPRTGRGAGATPTAAAGAGTGTGTAVGTGTGTRSGTPAAARTAAPRRRPAAAGARERGGAGHPGVSGV
ncbi:ClpA/ClpB-like protein [Streptomyces sp. Amel2xB2]|uniref:Clp protease N-terminal domain-containing protein n=1 Tax=Streptomyces sp. Amel2xB2 TaxID=1305829 RepID=UPI000DBFBE60|nr:Clp protease N-terminal domain-containing protein [Streptomyces sp. Amel2xB2]RAJ57510.1 ClpA/ClpB-like protein [Streptomyces sp. Amel2xB2]